VLFIAREGKKTARLPEEGDGDGKHIFFLGGKGPFDREKGVLLVGPPSAPQRKREAEVSFPDSGVGG